MVHHQGVLVPNFPMKVSLKLVEGSLHFIHTCSPCGATAYLRDVVSSRLFSPSHRNQRLDLFKSESDVVRFISLLTCAAFGRWHAVYPRPWPQRASKKSPKEHYPYSPASVMLPHRWMLWSRSFLPMRQTEHSSQYANESQQTPSAWPSE